MERIGILLCGDRYLRLRSNAEQFRSEISFMWIVGCFVLASFGLNEFVFTSFQRRKGPAIAKKVQCPEEKRRARAGGCMGDARLFSQKIAQPRKRSGLEKSITRVLSPSSPRDESVRLADRDDRSATNQTRPATPEQARRRRVLPSRMRDFEISCLGYPALKRCLCLAPTARHHWQLAAARIGPQLLLSAESAAQRNEYFCEGISCCAITAMNRTFSAPDLRCTISWGVAPGYR